MFAYTNMFAYNVLLTAGWSLCSYTVLVKANPLADVSLPEDEL